MKILQLTAFYLPSLGGIQYYVRNLSRSLRGLGHEIDILTMNTEDASTVEERPEGNVYRAPVNAMYHRGLVSRQLAARLLRRTDYDVIHVHVPFPFGLEVAAVAGHTRTIPVVVTHHGTDTTGDPLYSVIARSYDLFCRHLSLTAASAIVFLTESYRDEIKLRLSLRSRSLVVPTGADVEAFSPDVCGDSVRRKFGFKPEDVICLWVGSLSEHNRYKGVNYLLDALARQEAARLKLLVVGAGPLEIELKAQAVQLGLNARVHFAGAVENAELPAYYAASDIFALPSVRGPENSPVVVFEAMAAGRPVVASDLPGVRDVVSHNVTGMLVPPGHVTQLASTIACLGESRTVRDSLGQMARSRALNHSWSETAQQMESVYSDALRRG